MLIYKLGCIWGKGAPDFYEMIKGKDISLSHIHDCSPKKDSIILITKGHTVKAITILQEDCHPVTDNPELEDSFDEFSISYNNETLFAKSKWIELKPEDYFLFQTQDGICQVHKSEIHKITKSLISKYMEKDNLNKQIELLKYKKQIILQGPPGTGKTRLAKEIAQIIIGLDVNKKTKPSQITKFEIKGYLKPGLSISSVKDKSVYTILSISDNNVKLKLTNSSEYSPSFAEIIKWYYDQKWNKGEQIGGTDPYSAALAKYIYENITDSATKNLEQYKLIQFHPSYTYEDFVRGIVSIPNENGEGILYITENKILADFAERALKNQLDSQKGATELSKEKWLNEQFEKFIYFISEEREKNGNIELTDSVFLVELNEDAFRYKGLKGWSKKGNRMLFKDIKQAYLDENFERQDLIHNQNLSGLAKWHASYYIRVLDMFKSFLEENEIKFIANTTEKEELKNYVLIIDEINRANLPSVLGELIYALEYRDKPVESMYAIDKKNELILPSNLFIIGTMNTSDRSVGHIDYAIRRRFAFVDVLPKIGPIRAAGIDKFKNVCELFIEEYDAVDWKDPKFKPSKHISSEFKPEDVMIGHSYFITKEKDEDGKPLDEKKQMELKLKYEIVPILKEYIKDGILKESNELKTLISSL